MQNQNSFCLQTPKNFHTQSQNEVSPSYANGRLRYKEMQSNDKQANNRSASKNKSKYKYKIKYKTNPNYCYQQTYRRHAGTHTEKQEVNTTDNTNLNANRYENGNGYGNGNQHQYQYGNSSYSNLKDRIVNNRQKIRIDLSSTLTNLNYNSSQIGNTNSIESFHNLARQRQTQRQRQSINLIAKFQQNKLLTPSKYIGDRNQNVSNTNAFVNNASTATKIKQDFLDNVFKVSYTKKFNQTIGEQDNCNHKDNPSNHNENKYKTIKSRTNKKKYKYKQNKQIPRMGKDKTAELRHSPKIDNSKFTKNINPLQYNIYMTSHYQNSIPSNNANANTNANPSKSTTASIYAYNQSLSTNFNFNGSGRGCLNSNTNANIEKIQNKQKGTTADDYFMPKCLQQITKTVKQRGKKSQVIYESSVGNCSLGLLEGSISRDRQQRQTQTTRTSKTGKKCQKSPNPSPCQTSPFGPKSRINQHTKYCLSRYNLSQLQSFHKAILQYSKGNTQKIKKSLIIVLNLCGILVQEDHLSKINFDVQGYGNTNNNTKNGNKKVLFNQLYHNNKNSNSLENNLDKIMDFKGFMDFYKVIQNHYFKQSIIDYLEILLSACIIKQKQQHHKQKQQMQLNSIKTKYPKSDKIASAKQVQKSLKKLPTTQTILKTTKLLPPASQPKLDSSFSPPSHQRLKTPNMQPQSCLQLSCPSPCSQPSPEITITYIDLRQAFKKRNTQMQTARIVNFISKKIVEYFQITTHTVSRNGRRDGRVGFSVGKPSASGNQNDNRNGDRVGVEFQWQIPLKGLYRICYHDNQLCQILHQCYLKQINGDRKQYMDINTDIDINPQQQKQPKIPGPKTKAVQSASVGTNPSTKQQKKETENKLHKFLLGKTLNRVKNKFKQKIMNSNLRALEIGDNGDLNQKQKCQSKQKQKQNDSQRQIQIQKQMDSQINDKAMISIK